MTKNNYLNRAIKKISCGTKLFIKNKRGSVIEYILVVSLAVGVFLIFKDNTRTTVTTATTAITTAISGAMTNS